MQSGLREIARLDSSITLAWVHYTDDVKDQGGGETLRDGVGYIVHVKGLSHIGVEGVSEFGLGALSGGIVIYADNPGGTRGHETGSSRDLGRGRKGSLYVGIGAAVTPHTETDGGTRVGV